MIRVILVAAALLFVFSPRPAEALLCHAILGCSCNVTASTMNFGSINPLLNTETTAQSDVSVSCTGIIDAVPVVYARIGAGTHGTVANRRLQSTTGQQLGYNIYSSPNHTTVLGEGVGGYPMLAISGGLVSLGAWNTTVTIHGRIAPTTTARPGHYSDTVVVRIDW